MLNTDEVWKDIEEFKGRYQISNLGRIRSILTNHSKPCEFIRKTFIRSDSCKYEYVSLSIKDTSYSRAVHRLIAIAFIPNPENKPIVNHIDGIKTHNFVTNLEWTTQNENHKHAYKLGLHNAEAHGKKMVGRKHNTAISRYKNVSWDRNRKRWLAAVKHKGKVVKQKRFKNEKEAALYVNWIIDTYKLDRPKNIIS